MLSRVLSIASILLALVAMPAVLAEGESCTENDQCGTDEYCTFLYGSCLSDEPIGICRFVPSDAGCPAVYMPVCGCDLETYSNGCEADIAYVSILYPGECESCGPAGASCSNGRICRLPPGQCGGGNPGVCIPSAATEPRTFAFEGTIDTVFDGLGLVAGVNAGDRFHGSLRYDLTTPDTGGTGEGQFGVYLHESPPSGVRLVIGDLTARSVPGQPELTVFVHNDVGFAAADEFGFVSGNSELVDTAFTPDFLAIELDWVLSEFLTDPLTHVDLPSCPLDPALFENNLLSLRMDCLPCFGPAAFVDATGNIDVFESELVLRVDRDGLRWNLPENATAFDVVTGLLSGLGDFQTATTACLADDLAGTSLPLGPDPVAGDARWYLVRPERAQGPGSWDSSGLQQSRPRDRGIDESGVACF